ncbi:UDP-N-acetylmuramoyl-L-alanyl-D-glutamate--2,6-diaminopimelate ligase [Blattabacterium cuenoti]|uniref:UDP-N-acetylmuramoyl-L-alanyl-D-glutamate--2, 6-diaminopimelate ligase n=1 Tax=Blattabacterium cuenoti TaxID=1653831 RepID=UPI00163C7D5A|nr:UDP-N-acetylmuramoyl-L-alanyl-D-glutamate--2,6-diaminopimelate ligase [Blattabacterium cuenoti]
MKKMLRDVLKKVSILKIIGIDTVFIEGIAISSKEVNKNMIFVAKNGENTDGHKFIVDAIEKGANTILCEVIPVNNRYENVTYVSVTDSMIALGIISSNFYDHPTKKIKLIGVTGTNGKTSVVNILHQLFNSMGKKSILISTVGIVIISKKYPTTHTTPNIIDINKYLNLSIKKGCEYAFMEVSSHGIYQKRIFGLLFIGGIFTNITHDHLDYHKNFNNYLSTKKSFFESLSKESFALINSDDKNSKNIIKNILAKTFFYGLKKDVDFKIKILENSINGIKLLINGKKAYTKLIGEFNVYNILASYATSILLLGEKQNNKIIETIKSIKPIKGRFEQFSSKSGIKIIVDYAHNPDALNTIFNAIKKIKKNENRLICVIGCGGDRDKKKRSLMGKLVYEKCNVSIFTSDNPRNEDPEKILIDMKNFKSYLKKNILTFVSRKKAIETAIKIAKKKDIILIAGKGHEIFQEVKGKYYPFDDMKIAKEILRKYYHL